ncbi:MAG: biotin-dependent carboxyltransferase family protein [Cyclobacteriaceae bacterium]|nr:biotin-dependent carboxyltransferase family protein [Cyclobacteriaceae bacterium]UYN87253.1 MAG: biotin-dependent carboxyltransferase family protein [Cyclobacteriaceae bacterium]
MSIEVIKAGMADSVQDTGRFGYQHLGINPSGVMDQNAMKIANALVGNPLNEAIVEMSFPAAALRFNSPAVICISGADFTPKLNGRNIPVNQPVVVTSGSELKFTKMMHGAWCYLAVQGGYELTEWLGSDSTSTKAKAGGMEGRFLKKGDIISFSKQIKEAVTKVFPWRADVSEFYEPAPMKMQPVRCIQGNEFDWLTKGSQKDFLKHNFIVSRQSDRMGYRLEGTESKQSKKQELLSTAVSFGTIQLLPNGELIALMADHQTTGGYPRIAHVITADRSRLAQCRPAEKISFSFVDIKEAEALLLKQEQSLSQLQQACKFKLREHEL